MRPCGVGFGIPAFLQVIALCERYLYIFLYSFFRSIFSSTEKRGFLTSLSMIVVTARDVIRHRMPMRAVIAVRQLGVFNPQNSKLQQPCAGPHDPATVHR